MRILAPLSASITLLFLAVSAWGADPAMPELPDINSLFPAPAAKTIFKSIGVTNNYRAFQGATPRGINGFDFGLEATLVHLPSDFSSSLAQGGGDAADSSTSMGVLPSVKFQLYKGLGPAADLGLSGFYLPGYTVFGISFKTTLYNPEEGLAWAFRLSYSDVSIDTSKIGIKAISIPIDGVKAGEGHLQVAARNISPQIVASRKLDFAEPYIGVGADWVRGQIQIPVRLYVQSASQTLITPAQTAYQFHAFTGVNFRIIPLGIRIAMEGSYGTSGMHSLGTIVGLSY